MPTFSYNARDNRGQWHKGTLAADNPAGLAGALRARGLSLINAQAADDAPANAPRRRRGILPAQGIDIELGLRMLATMVDSGLTLMSALKTCAEQARRQSMAFVWLDVHDRIAGGMSLAEAMARHRRLFPQLVIQLVRAGEISGNLELVLDQAATQLERKRNLMITLVSALLYPTITTIVAFGVAAYLVLKVIPEISGFITSGGKKLPAMTQALLNTSQFINHYIWPITIVSAALVAAFFIGRMFPPVGKVIDALTLRIPIMGKLLRLSGTTLFARSLGMLLDAGVPVLAAMETAGGLIKNRAMSGRVEFARQSVLGGNTLARPLAAGKEFMPMLPRMVAVGEETGTLSNVLAKVADFHEQQLHSYVKRMTLLIEPVMTVIVGSMVGFVYLAFFMAIYSISAG